MRERAQRILTRAKVVKETLPTTVAAAAAAAGAVFALPPSLKQRVRAFKMQISACDARARPARRGRRAASRAAPSR